MPRRATLVAAVALVVLAAGCSGADPDSTAKAPDAKGAGGSSAATTSTPAPALENVDGYRRLNTLPPPIAQEVVVDNTQPQPRTARVDVVRLDKVGDVVRAVLAWDKPQSGPAASGDRIRTLRPPVDAQYEIGLQLYDPAAGTLAGPLRDASGACICSRNTLSMTSDAKQSLFWADFPAPASSTVTLLMGAHAAPLQGLPVTTGAPPLTLPDALAQWVVNRPPDTPGQGAAAPVVRQVRRTAATFGGAEDSQIAGTADVSVPSDVLFAFDSAALTTTAKRILAKAAPALVAAASGKAVQVVGHTDDQGSGAYNNALSLRRAQAVVAALRPTLSKAGITLKAVGKGETQPLVPNLTKSGKPIAANRQRNRRVSFVFARAKGGSHVEIDVPKPLPKMAVAKSTTASPQVEGALASVLSASGQARLDVTRAERVGADVWIQLDFTAVGEQAPWGANSGILDQNPIASNATMTGVRLVDTVKRTVAPPLAAADGICVCTEDMGSGRLYPQPLGLWALFPAPDPATTKITLRVPGVGQVVDVPLG